MKKFANFISKHKNLVIGFSVILFILSLIGNALTHINYDILVYLPSDIETIKGQNILTDDFNMGGYSIAVVDKMNAKQIIKLENDIKNISGVGQVISLYDIVGTTIPVEMLPMEIVSKLNSGDSDLLFITFTDSTSSELTLNAIEEIRSITKDYVKLGGMSSMVLDTMNLSNKEIAIYIIIAVILCILVLEMSLDSYIVPILLLANIGVSIIFNLGSNIFLGQISYITKALVAVLQLGVTTDFSIFLYHSYEAKKKTCKTHEDAMVEAICETFTSVTGSSLTTIIGFLVLITMNLTLGTDLGIVMAKGVALGVITVLTLFPSLLLAFDKLIDKTRHKTFIPNFSKLYKFVIKHNKVIFASFLVLLIPFYLANNKVDVYYKIDKTLPDTLESIQANKILKDKFNMVSMEIVLLDKNLKQDDMNALVSDLQNTDGIDFVLTPSKLQNLNITNDMIPDELLNTFQSEKYQMLMFNSIYDIASDELNNQVEIVDEIVKKYDKNAIVAGEGPLMKDLIEISNTDFNNVNISSIACIFLILFIVLKSLSLPFLLITTIEFAIFLNMGVAYFGGNVLPFVAPIVLGTIQLGATIDYAILMTTTYLEKRKSGLEKKEAMYKTLEFSGNSIFVSGMCFFAATFGVGVYSDLEMVGSLCTLISRGAIISMIVVIMVLPSILLIFDKLIMKTTIIRKEINKNMKNKNLKKLSLGIIIGGTLLVSCPIPTYALIKDETVYTKLNYDGSVINTLVNNKLINDDNLEEIEDYTTLKNILNLSNDNSYSPLQDRIIWNSYGKNIAYQGSTTKTLPVSVKVKYYLDNVETNLEDMIGKSGKVKIVLDYENTDKHTVKINGKNETLYTPFMVTTGTIIDDENNTNISVSNGKVINNGTNNIIIGIAMPEFDKSLNMNELKSYNSITISYDTTKFELASIYSVVMPKVISSDDIDFSKLNTIYSKVNTLQSGIDKIQTGVKELSTNGDTINSGISLISDNLNVVSTKFKEIQNGSTSLYNGLTEMIKQLNEAKKLLNQNAIDISSITALVKGNNDAISSLKNANSTLNSKAGTNLSSIDINTLDSTNPLYEVKVMYDSNVKLISLLTKNNGYIDKSLQTVTSVQKNITSLINELEKYLTQLQSGSKTLMQGTATIYDGLNTLATKSKELNTGMNTYNVGVKTLEAGIITYNKDGIKQISNLVNNNIKGMSTRLQEIVKLGEDYQSFSGKTNSTSGETKFVLVIDGKKSPKEEIKTNTEAKKVSLWQRFINLFK